MNDMDILDLYSDYLLTSFGLVTATGLSAMLDGAVSHDAIQRFLAGRRKTSSDLWQIVKPHVAVIQDKNAAVIIDDSISEKEFTDENDIICWHYDHSKDRNVKGINFVSCLYHGGVISLPVAFELVAKTEKYTDPKTGKEKRRSKKTKNELYREMLAQVVNNNCVFKYVLNDIWFASAENMTFVKTSIKKDFVMPLKDNRKVALSEEAKRNGRYQRVGDLVLEPMRPITVYLEKVNFPLLLIKRVFKNEDGSTGILYLVTSDLTLSGDDIATIYQKRWNVEVYHKSLKQNASLEKSPTKTVTTQANHFFAALCAYVKLELLKCSTKMNHFALKSRFYFQALRSSYAMLLKLNPFSLVA
jgi:hypothetical protein